MNVEKQVCSLELAKKLKNLGVKQNSLWYWAESTSLSIKTMLAKSSRLVRKTKSEILGDTYYSAFTCAELGEMLQDYSGNVEYNGKFKKWKIIYLESSYTTEIVGSEADARAKLLIYLLENKLLDKPKLKED